jgi:hypothetical protein
MDDLTGMNLFGLFFMVTEVLLLVLLFVVMQPVYGCLLPPHHLPASFRLHFCLLVCGRVVYRLVSSLYTFVRFRKGKLYVWQHEMAADNASAPICVRKRCCTCDDPYQSFPCCCCCVEFFPTTQAMVRYLLWMGVSAVGKCARRLLLVACRL